MEFRYLIDKIRSARFQSSPFRFLQIDDFLSPAHFEALSGAPELERPVAADTKRLIEDLQQTGYEVQPFPGCTSSVADYLAWLDSRRWPEGAIVGDVAAPQLLDGFGLTLRLHDCHTPLVERFVAFLRSAEFEAVLEEKFALPAPCRLEAGIQKYLHGYEISPHPDLRRKALTWMLNLNTSEASEDLPIHTHLLRFRPERRWVSTFWRDHPEIDRCWVPWDWCESVTETRANNSIVLFAPADDTLHAVKLHYDHLGLQRTQAYGNLWYDEPRPLRYIRHQDLETPSRGLVGG